MLRTSRPLLITASVLALSISAVGGASALPFLGGDKAAAVQAAPRPGQWPQAASDIAADPSIRFGSLPNGMRYAIRRNATPPGQASIRLRFDAGSLMETEAQQGLAHFLEHMAFNGSKTVPEGEMIKILERHGLAFGADTNASTSWNETIYKLDLPKTDDETVKVSLDLMRDVASELTISGEAVDRERGVILSEERDRDTPAYRVFKEGTAFLLKGQRPPERLPIGKVDVIKTAPREQLVDYYQRFYRPERAVLVVVGDFDVDAMEAKIKARFSDWQGVGPAGADPDLGAVAKRGVDTKVIVQPGAATSLQVSWLSPPDLAPDTSAVRKRDLIERLGFAVLNRRFSALSRGSDPQFIAAGAFAFDQFHAARATTISATAEPTGWRQALAAIDLEQRRIARYGVRQDELDREIAEIRTGLEARVAGAATQRTPVLANIIVGSLDDHEVVTSPAQDLAWFNTAVKDLKAETVSDAMKKAFEGSGPVAILSTGSPVQGGDKALADELASARKVEVTPQAANASIEWPYLSFGTPGTVAEQKDVTDLDATFIRFTNGVRLTVKPTKFRDDQVLVKVRIGDGYLGLPSDRQSAGWAGSSFAEGGLAKINAQDMERVLADKVWGAQLGTEEDAFTLSGGTRTADLSTELQVLAAYATEPGWRPEAFQRIKTFGQTLHDQYEATDNGVLARDLSGLLRSGDRRFTFPSRQEMAAAKIEDLKTQLAPLSTGQIEVIIVGDITVEKATQAVAETFGALPARMETGTPGPEARVTAFPKPTATPVRLTHKGREDQGMAYIAWQTDDFFANPQQARNITILADVFRLRLQDELREKQGATYSPSAGSTASFVWTDFGYVAVSVEAPPATLDSVFKTVSEIAADLRAKPPSDDELARAKKPRLEGLEKARVTNEYWVGQLSGAQTDPRRLDATRSVQAGVERVSPQDVQKAAQSFLGDDRAWKLVIVPEK
ncbi:insulinase family protein [Caulobacter segnis]|uniref:M16 family metallopeptidase n=1 Tax=Caulobacter segnis TaxID=88688 RepID=UPI00240EFC54|nr:M16 family metallopeptidase [Caulobacter segnis]MDG2522626.1 insulinase family protein [Caulobacter segnis]